MGFPDTERANAFAEVIGDAARIVSTVIDLDRLDGITVGFDYDAALASLDRGISSTQPLKKTSSDLLLGVAMTPTVLRDGVIKAHMIFYAPVVMALDGADEEAQRRALFLLAHESGHVEAIKHLDTAFPETLLRCAVKTKNVFLYQVAESIWSEYCACRTSAIFGREQTSIYEDALASVLKVARDRANAAIRDYRFHHDLNRVTQEAGQHICEPLRIGAYLFGHLDGLGLDLGTVPAAEIREAQYERCMIELRDALRSLWSRLGRWSDVAEFHVLENVAKEAMAERGMIFEDFEDGSVYLHIP